MSLRRQSAKGRSILKWMHALLIKNATLYAPERLDNYDMLTVDGTILQVERHIAAHTFSGIDVTVIDAAGCFVTPGFIDTHNHLLGACGKFGYGSLAPEIPVAALIKAGITTVVGLLGADAIGRLHRALLAKVRNLNSLGLTAYMLTGSYEVPLRTLTGALGDDIYLIPEVIGVGEIAVADLLSSCPTVHELRRIVKNTMVVSRLRGIRPFVCLHVGGQSLAVLDELVGIGELGTEYLLLTHVNRNVERLKEMSAYAKAGCYLDLTAVAYTQVPDNPFVAVAAAVQRLQACNVPLEKVTISSDAGTLAEDRRLTKPSWLLASFQQLARSGVLPLADTVQLFSTNEAEALGLTRKGRLAAGFDGDFLFFDNDFTLQRVIAGGRTVFEEGEVTKRDCYDNDSYL
jgi:beta-aspartyl-dipeptidase (metallo-type)